ncbi:DUF4345 domain-containing protein [Azospirillum brasilense]|uniref:DUF4345 domain-containing protein n=1 Tax=Azospirillum brasilense TaxID=192 RepID=UPI000E0C972D|nr:DUF4345 domain-containing protein [Azospirillum brasilense]
MLLVLLLRINAVLFALFGIAFVLQPAEMAHILTGTFPQTASALTDMRATYGGIPLGFAAFLGWAGFTRQAERTAGLAVLLVLAGLALGRVVGILVDGSLNAIITALLLSELLGVALMAAALKRPFTMALRGSLQSPRQQQ